LGGLLDPVVSLLEPGCEQTRTGFLGHFEPQGRSPSQSLVRRFWGSVSNLVQVCELGPRHIHAPSVGKPGQVVDEDAADPVCFAVGIPRLSSSQHIFHDWADFFAK